MNNPKTSRWEPISYPLESYSIGTKVRESWSYGYWIKVCRGWKWCTGDTFTKPGNADQVMLPEDE